MLFRSDDAALVHDSEEWLRLMVDLFMEMKQACGMKVSLDKMKITAINPTTPLTHFVYGPTEHDTIKVVQEFVYIGTNLAVLCAADEAVKYRIEKARRVFTRVSCVQPSQSPKSVEGYDVCCVCVGNAFVRP